MPTSTRWRHPATVATLLPGVEFSTRQPYPDARRLIGAGVTVAIASDCNPGSCFTSSMPLCIALAVREMRMTTEEAVWAATAGGARALRRADVGHLGPGARADLIMLNAPSHAYLAYRPGVPLIAAVWQGGNRAQRTGLHAVNRGGRERSAGAAAACRTRQAEWQRAGAAHGGAARPGRRRGAGRPGRRPGGSRPGGWGRHMPRRMGASPWRRAARATMLPRRTAQAIAEVHRRGAWRPGSGLLAAATVALRRGPARAGPISCSAVSAGASSCSRWR